MLRKTVDGYTYEEFIYCGCNCGFTRSRYDDRGRECKYKNHHARGYTLSEETRKKIGEARKGKKLSEEHKMKCIKNILRDQTGEKNHMWKGDNVSYGALHDWIKRYFPKPQLCEICHKVPPRDLANITGIYNREFKNWAYFCYHCHRKYDNIAVRGWITKRKKGT